MKKTRVISLALVAMLFFSLTAFTPAAKAVKAGSNLGTPITLQAKKACSHNYITTQYGDWELREKSDCNGNSAITKYTYRRTVTEVCTKCANVKTHYEYKYVYKWYDLITITER